MTGSASSTLRAGLGVVLLWALIALPSAPGDYRAGHFVPPPMELALVILVLALLPSRGAILRIPLIAALAVLTFLRLADTGMILAFERGFNPLLDWPLLLSAWELSRDSFGPIPTLLGIAAAFLAFAGLFVLLSWSLRGVSHLPARARYTIAALGFAGMVVGPATLPGEITARTDRLAAALDAEARFATDLLRDDAMSPDFAALEGRDVVILFVESYGRSWLDAPAYRETSQRRLAEAEAQLHQSGIAMRSAWMESPTRGGQSWLAHGAAMSGLWTSSQARYDALIASTRPSLNHLFSEAGWRSVAIMPAITRDWPEAEWFGYDVIRARDDLGYEGEPFEWVTMPDQYTLSVLDGMLEASAQPIMAEVALISSHAPWTPIPQIVPWDEIGDGSIFDGTRRAGDTPREVWSAPESIRAAYSRALDYAIEVIAGWAARAPSDAVVVILGDHQPAPLVAGEGASAAVPVHILSRDASLLSRLPGAWSEGMLPSPDLPDRRMTDLRDILTRCFSSEGCPEGAS